MKKLDNLLIYAIFFFFVIVITSNASAVLCKGPDGYYDDCYKLEFGHYPGYNYYEDPYVRDDYSYNFRHNSNYPYDYDIIARDDYNNQYNINYHNNKIRQSQENFYINLRYNSRDSSSYIFYDNKLSFRSRNQNTNSNRYYW